ncbi:MAG: ABC transporter permease [Anaerotignaceae bacterium]
MENKRKKLLIKFFAVVFWLMVWQVSSMVVGKELIMPSPFRVLETLFLLIKRETFWISIFSSMFGILKGFVFAVLVGIILAVITAAVPYMEEFFYPILSVIKATPVASFIILAILWIKTANIPVFICFLMVMPIIYTNVYKGIEETDKKLLEMAKVYNFSKLKTIKLIYVPSCLGYFYSACIMGIGFGWKSGIAAEVIATPKLSIGTNLYHAKIYLETAELFAWTLVVIVLSIIIERLFKFIVGKWLKKG